MSNGIEKKKKSCLKNKSKPKSKNDSQSMSKNINNAFLFFR